MEATDLGILVSLDALLQEGSVTGAARRVGLSTPAMSHALARIRDRLGDPILVRSGRGMLLTPRALALKAQVHHVVTEARRTLEPERPFVASELSRRAAHAPRHDGSDLGADTEASPTPLIVARRATATCIVLRCRHALRARWWLVMSLRDPNPSSKTTPRRIAIVVANPTLSSTTGWPVGFWWSELTHPYLAFHEAGYEVEVFSPAGGRCEADGLSDPRDAAPRAHDAAVDPHGPGPRGIAVRGVERASPTARGPIVRTAPRS